MDMGHTLVLHSARQLMVPEMRLDLNEPGNYLQSAAAYSSLEVTELLIQHGAQIEQSGAMHKAAENGRMGEWTSWNESCVMERMATSNYGQISRIQHATGPG
ncbi:hypothetical protein HBI72_147930 [Parastagonospora nodorum]|nr:hypothetical protein HBI72_147930 [Parastagonospora nodorum]